MSFGCLVQTSMVAPVWRALGASWLVTGLLALLSWWLMLVFGHPVGLLPVLFSVWIGCAAAVLPGLMAWFGTRRGAATPAALAAAAANEALAQALASRRLVRLLLWWLIKLLLSVTLLVLALRQPSVRSLPLLAGFATALFVFWFFLLTRSKR